ncbi:MAG TPA: polysaccharide deacetylase family protein [Mycobacteriales bacterium]|nr:polysaccharide deacetylase family protein [Mycobacteriales bacterium]
MRRTLTFAAIAAAGVQVGPAATWLPPVRRALAPSLLGRGRPSSVALTFDDGPHPDGTPAVLHMLAELGWTATFFVLGSQTRRHPDVAREIVQRGHEVAVHGDEHRYLIARPPWTAYDDLRRARESVEDITQVEPKWWRPPYGVLSGPGLLAGRLLKLRPVLWSAWGRDWRSDATADSVVTDLLATAPAGGTLLLHDSDVTSAPGSWRTTVAALPLLAERMSTTGLRVGPLRDHGISA